MPSLVGRIRRPEVALFVWVLGTYAYFFQAGGWNANVRFALVRSLVEQGRVAIDDYRHASGDLAKRQGHFYCDKAPGVSVLSVPVYAPVRAAQGPGRPSRTAQHAALYLVTLVVIGVPSALAAALLFHLARHFTPSPWPRLALALAYSLGSPAFPYATLYYGHQLVAALLLGAFAALLEMRWASARQTWPRLALVGVLMGLAVAAEYPAAMVVVLLLAYAASCVRPWSRLWAVVAGLVPTGLGLALYHAAAFGGPWALGYQFSTQGNRRAGLFMGLAAIDWRALHGILVSEYRGVFYSAPWLALALPGGIALWRRGWRREVALCALVFLGFLWMNASLVDWQGGWTFGPRYLVPAIPFLAILAMGLLPWLAKVEDPNPRRRWLRRAAAAAAALLVVDALVMMLIATSVWPEIDMRYTRPFAHFLFDAFADGRLAVNAIPVDARQAVSGEGPQAWNLGQLFGLEGLVSLVPLGAWTLLGAAAWVETVRPTRRPPRSAAQPSDR